jgi:tRNA(Glu) U13 pseudouridine synthase TruD
MFVHSVESKIFNMELEQRIGEGKLSAEEGDMVCGAGPYGFPDLGSCRIHDATGYSFLVGNIVGYDTEHVNDHEKRIMEELGVAIEDFKIKGMPELNCKGTRRVLFAPYKDFSIEQREDSAVLGFSLPSGSYATVLASEFLAGV